MQFLIIINLNINIFIFLRRIPVIKDPIVGVILNRLVTLVSSISLSLTLFSVINTQLSLPLIPTDVKPEVFTA